MSLSGASLQGGVAGGVLVPDLIAWSRLGFFFSLLFWFMSCQSPQAGGLRMRTAAAFSFEEGYEQLYFIGPFL